MKYLYKNVSLHLSKILSCKHPIKDIAKTLISPNQQRRHGVIVNLFSKAIGISRMLPLQNRTTIPEVLALQQKLSEITDMMYAARVLHQGVLNFADVSSEDKTEEKFHEIHTGNCLSILIGDQLLANASRGLAELRNPFIVEWMSKALEDFSTFSFLNEEEVDLSQPECTLKSIEQRCHLSGGSLLANSCKSAALLAGYSLNDDKELLNDAFDIGNNIGVTFQLQDLLDANGHKLGNLEKLSKEDTTNYLKKVLDSHVTNCLHLTDKLPKCEASINIRNIVVTIASKYIDQRLREQRL